MRCKDAQRATGPGRGYSVVMATLHLMVGLPCSGKTTLAKELEEDFGALRLTADEWHRHLFGQDATHPDHDDRHGRVEELQWRVASDALRQGLDAILDFGFWQRQEREVFRARAAALGAATVIHFLDVAHEELFERLRRRNEQAPEEVTHIPPSMLEEWIPYFQPPDAEELGTRGG